MLFNALRAYNHKQYLKHRQGMHALPHGAGEDMLNKPKNNICIYIYIYIYVQTYINKYVNGDG